MPASPADDRTDVAPDDEHDRRLLANVRPPEWENPVPAAKYDLVVIGAGAAGLVAAAGAAGLGARVALVERHLLGGDCLHTGCVPSKALLRSSRAAAQVRAAADYGVEVPPGTRVDFPAVMARMRCLRAEISPNDSAARFRGLGVDLFLGEGRFTGPRTVEVGGATLRFRRACIATGARPSVPAIPGLSEAGFLTNETLFSIATLPARLAILGGGPIGCEMAQAFARFGARVHLLEIGTRLLPREETQASALLRRTLERDGVDVRLATEMVRVEGAPSGKRLHLRAEGVSRTVDADAILVAVGRTPNVEGLALEAAGVAYDPREGVTVDDRLRTTQRSIFAAGDVASRFKFTHAADAMARIVIRNALFFGRARASALTIPWCTYTAPEVARVGLDEGEARARGIETDAFVQDLREVDRAILDGEEEGFVKVIVKKGTDRILGATIVAAHAGEMIGEITMAITRRIGLGKIAGVIHPYPTQAEAIRKLGDAFQRTRLTEGRRRLLRRYFAWLR